jgi:hypothetical protein
MGSMLFIRETIGPACRAFPPVVWLPAPAAVLL